MRKNTTWVIGHHAVQAVLSKSPERAIAVFAVINSRNQKQAALLQQARRLGLSINPLDKRALQKLCGSEQHQGIALQAKPKQEENEQQLLTLVIKIIEGGKEAPLLLVLDQVQDPHNFGACLRTADAAGVDAVVVAKDNASPLTPVVQKVASGAAESVDIFRVTNLSRSLQSLKELGVWVIGTSDKASSSIYQTDLTVPLALVMGAEGSGLRSLTEKTCDSLVQLPMASGVVSSLNVSVATGVCLYEAVRQRTNTNGAN